MNELLDLLHRTGALLRGHFILRSGLHSREFFQCSLLLQYAKTAEYVCGLLAEKLLPFGCQTVVSPALGGILVGHEIARHLNGRHIFVEKGPDGELALRRGFTVSPGEKIAIAEDVVTRGGRVQQASNIIQSLGGVIVAIASIIDRSGGATPDFGCPFIRLVQLEIDTFETHNLPPDLKALPAIRPGGYEMGKHP
ncbi:Orotate phosphoribosyltransferase [Candidatus Xiphinematobacter sp. Idaho Grape]|uniref:orotate phosphoribosyltransferase n=1 Tax=Candidatus Xiphinematobacter sp. Idaho Grape TaxID=1704307 RepID=UPI0007068A87|nr:orotate phosphoribosyltransferase [Candidatus Xiphinematobacter sp. Idaho Grape]ALJ56998.1 Orotate phosphoribosyltransferase [Candidatus Xiphinematobacter sp. Idaho Grape]